MFCGQCGKQISNDQTFCPNCGMKIQKDIPVNNMNNVNNVINNVSTNVNEPSNSIGFNRNGVEDLERLNYNNYYQNANQQIANGQQNISINNSSSQINTTMPQAQGNNNVPAGMNMPVNNNRKFPWIPIAIGLVIIMVIGIVFLPGINRFIFKSYQNDEYSLKYNYNWSLDSEADGLLLYYSDDFSNLSFNASTKFSDFSYKLTDEKAKKVLYEIFYDIWSDTEGIKLKGGTSTFLVLDNGSFYARIDYTYTADNDKVGAFYILINEEYDSVISFIATSTQSKWEDVNNDIVSMLESVEYIGETIGEKNDKDYAKFDAGVTDEYSVIGYMEYSVPDTMKREV